MNQEAKDQGVLTVMLERLEKQRLPRLLDMNARVSQGEVLNDADLAFLGESMQDARQSEPLIAEHPDYQSFAAKLADLYKEITDKALANQERESG